MELGKLVAVLKEKFEEKLKTEVKVLVGGSYALKQVYGLLDRRINDIDIIIVPSHSFYYNHINYNLPKEEREKIENEHRVKNEALLAEILQSVFPTEEIHDTRMDYHGTEEHGCWMMNSKLNTLVGFAKTTLNFLVNCKMSNADFNSRITHEGVPVVPLEALLRAKGSYNRIKDQVDFYNMSKKLTDCCKGDHLYL